MQNINSDPVFVSPSKAAKRLGIGLNTLRKELKNPDTFVSFFKIGSAYKIDIDATIDNLRRKESFSSYVKRDD